jgi:hypothetical protein
VESTSVPGGNATWSSTGNTSVAVVQDTAMVPTSEPSTAWIQAEEGEELWVVCGPTVCGPGMDCCNELCGLCVPSDIVPCSTGMMDCVSETPPAPAEENP